MSPASRSQNRMNSYKMYQYRINNSHCTIRGIEMSAILGTSFMSRVSLGVLLSKQLRMQTNTNAGITDD